MAKQKKKTESNYFLHKGKLFRENEVDGLYSVGEHIPLEERDALLSWKGSLLPYELHRQIISFFFDGYEKTKSENLIWLYYDLDTGEWIAWAPPQNCNGMTVSADPECKEFKEQRKQIEERFVQLGTYHHHCTGNAFASGTDKDDECDRDGLHITVGGVGQHEKDLSFHTRVTLRGVTYEGDILDWISVPEWMEHVPEALQEALFSDMLAMPEKDLEYPELWLENAKKKYGAVNKVYSPGVQRSFPEWGSHQHTTQNTKSTGMRSTGKEASGKLARITIMEAIEEVSAEDIEDPKDRPSQVDRLDLANILRILFENNVDASTAEDLFQADEDMLTSPDIAVLEILKEKLHLCAIFAGRAKYLFMNFPIVEMYDRIIEFAAAEELAETQSKK